MADKKVTPPLAGYPQQPPQGPFLPQPPQHAAPQYGAVGGGVGYGVSFGAGMGGMGGMTGVGGMAGVGGVGGGVYAPPYDQLQHHQPLPQHLPMYSPAAMYAAAAGGYGGYIGYPVQYYPYYPMQPSIQPLRPTIMIPNGLEGGGRLEGLLPPAPPAPHLALQPHQVLIYEAFRRI